MAMIVPITEVLRQKHGARCLLRPLRADQSEQSRLFGGHREKLELKLGVVLT